MPAPTKLTAKEVAVNLGGDDKAEGDNETADGDFIGDVHVSNGNLFTDEMNFFMRSMVFNIGRR